MCFGAWPLEPVADREPDAQPGIRLNQGDSSVQYSLRLYLDESIPRQIMWHSFKIYYAYVTMSDKIDDRM